ncbi:MAG TPA: LppX_LprAFG lipoprotein [Acidimicrobiales bacterium]|nr:LppX_LprAFG lipoprotein [Acidimicrobiales bacterium]
MLQNRPARTDIAGAGRAELRIRAGALAAGAALLASLGAACSSGKPANAQSLLSSAKATLDNTPSAHFTLSSTNATTSGGTTITGGQGDMQRPDKLKGSLDVVVRGVNASVQVVAVGDQVYAKLPFAATFSKIDPSTFGLGNPSQMFDPSSGLSTLLSVASGAKVTGQERINGELVDEVSATVPGSAVPVLPDANPSAPVRLVAAIDPGNHQLRRVTLTGPFVKANASSTFTLTLTSYGEKVQITLPPAS